MNIIKNFNTNQKSNIADNLNFILKKNIKNSGINSCFPKNLNRVRSYQ